MEANSKYETLIKKHRAVLAQTSRELAMNFDVPARSIIQMACSDMRISEKLYREIQSYIIAKEEYAAGQAWLAAQKSAEVTA